MKKFSFLSMMLGLMGLIFLSGPSSAQTAIPPSAKPNCGTIDECQKKITELMARPTITSQEAQLLRDWLLSPQFTFRGDQAAQLVQTINDLVAMFQIQPKTIPAIDTGHK